MQAFTKEAHVVPFRAIALPQGEELGAKTVPRERSSLSSPVVLLASKVSVVMARLAV